MNNKNLHNELMKVYQKEHYKLPEGRSLIYIVWSKHFNTWVYAGQTNYALKHRIGRHKSAAKHNHNTCSFHKHIREHGMDDLHWKTVCEICSDSVFTEHDAAVRWGTYAYFNDKSCEGAPKDFIVSKWRYERTC